MGSEALQNGSRPCGSTVEWTSGQTFEERRVANIADGKPKTIARYATNDKTSQRCSKTDSTRADENKPDVGWNFGPDDDASNADSRPASKRDPDFPSAHRMAQTDWSSSASPIRPIRRALESSMPRQQ